MSPLETTPTVSVRSNVNDITCHASESASKLPSNQPETYNVAPGLVNSDEQQNSMSDVENSIEVDGDDHDPHPVSLNELHNSMSDARNSTEIDGGDYDGATSIENNESVEHDYINEEDRGGSRRMRLSYMLTKLTIWLHVPLCYKIIFIEVTF